MSKMRQTDRANRDKELFKFYESLLIKYRNQHGDASQYIPKGVLYEEVGERFFITAQTASKIIQSKLKHGNKPLNQMQ